MRVMSDSMALPAAGAPCASSATAWTYTVSVREFCEFTAKRGDLDRRFTLAAGLIELADREFGAIRDRLQAGLGDSGVSAADALDPRISAQELATFLAGRYSSAGWSRTDHYEWISGLLLELGIASLDELSATLRDVDSTAVTAAMGYRYPPGAVRRLDDDLLSRFGEVYVALHGNAHRRESLEARRAHLTT